MLVHNRCSGWRFFQLRTSALFCAKTFKFFKTSGVFDGQGGLSQCRHFADKEGGVNFLQFCADVLYGQPLTIKHNLKIQLVEQQCNHDIEINCGQ